VSNAQRQNSTSLDVTVLTDSEPEKSFEEILLRAVANSPLSTSSPHSGRAGRPSPSPVIAKSYPRINPPALSWAYQLSVLKTLNEVKNAT